MKIAYIINHNVSLNDGVIKKIKGQTDFWSSQGHQVSVFAYTDSADASILVCRRYCKGGLISFRLLPNKLLISDMDNFSPDVIYYRYDTWNYNFHVFSKKYPIVLELNTLDVDEFKSLVFQEKSMRALVRFLAYFLMRGLVFRASRAIVGVTQEILQTTSVKKFAKMSICAANSIHFKHFPIIKDTDSAQTKKGLFFIGTPGQHWHGVDLIEQLAKFLPQYHFHIVGESGENCDNISYYGYLTQEQYRTILQSCVVCLGTLGLFRKNMREASPLKVREYLSYGFPIIIGYHDTAFPNAEDFILKVDFQNQTIEHIAKQVCEFVEKNKGRIVQHREVEAIGSEFVEVNRLNFLTSVLQKYRIEQGKKP